MPASFLNKKVSNAPLVHFRVGFGLLMLFSTLRFVLNGWVNEFYIQPKFHFTYYAFDWVKPTGQTGMYLVFAGLLLFSLFIILGLFYRLSALAFFLLFTYVELLDKTFYLNHYYFVSLISFILIFLPANKRFSLDAKWGFTKPEYQVPYWFIVILIVQVGIVYAYAGFAKINADWLLNAQPLRIWLMPRYDTFLIGPLLEYNFTHYLFAWFGMIFDCTVVFFMLWSKTRNYTYPILVIFHLLTALLFPIGVFPFVMIFAATIFFSPYQHEKLLSKFSKIQPYTQRTYASGVKYFFAVFLVLQLLIPWRYLLYPGNLFWTEEGFRFSWRVMLVEKEGEAFFYMKLPNKPGYKPIDQKKYLIPQQIKQMAYQPDMLVQFAHFLKSELEGKTIDDFGEKVTLENVQICADVYVAMNGRKSKKLIDKKTVLSDQPYNLYHRNFVLPFE